MLSHACYPCHCTDDDPANWHTMKVWFNDQVFDSAEALMAAFKASDPNGPPDAEGHIPLKAYSTKMPSKMSANVAGLAVHVVLHVLQLIRYTKAELHVAASCCVQLC